MTRGVVNNAFFSDAKKLGETLFYFEKREIASDLIAEWRVGRERIKLLKP